MFACVWFTAFGHCDVCLSLVDGFWVNQTKANITMAKSRKPNKGKHHNGQKP
jgi:hypothetical protein